MTVIDVTAHYPIPLVWPRPAMDFKRVDAIAIHHTVTFFLKPSATVAEEQDHIAMIHEYHFRKGWGGFAYHLISFPSGRVYHVVPLSQWGAHVHAENDHLYGIVVAGDFTDRVPTRAQQQGVAEGIRLIYATLNRQVSIRPHRSWGGTSCPGATWKQWVPNLTALVEAEEEEEAMKLGLIQRQAGGAQYVTDWVHKWVLPSGAVRDELVALGILDGRVVVVSDKLFHALSRPGGTPVVRDVKQALREGTG